MAKSYRNLLVMASPRAGGAPLQNECFTDDSNTSLLGDKARLSGSSSSSPPAPGDLDISGEELTAQ